MPNANPMQQIFVEKVVLHATTSDQEKLEKYRKLLEYITKRKPVLTKAKKRIQAFKIRRGLPIGYKVTLRKKHAIEILKILLAGVKHQLSKKQVDKGVINFGIKEYITLPGIDYRRDIGILGFDVSVVLAKKGKRVIYRKRCKSKIGKRQQVTTQEAIEFMEKNFGVKFV
ncbi:MAG: 50S ribosomal protein L5 [Candidatus Pacearchaeota archaeon]